MAEFVSPNSFHFFFNASRAMLPLMSNLTIKQELELLRSAVIGLIGEDSEGAYRPEFVESTFAALQRKPTRRFVSAEQFLRDIKRA